MIEIAGGVVWNKKLGIAVVNQHHNSWSLPKGHVEQGENLLTAAKREIYEETGIPINKLVFVGKIAEYERPRIKRKPSDQEELRRITLFLFTTTEEELNPIDPENPEAQWVAPPQVPGLLTHAIDKEEFQRMIMTDIFNK